MCSGLIALRAAGAAAVLVLAPATAAYAGGTAKADDTVKVTVSPSGALPGSAVELHVSGCKGATAAATSLVFATDIELTGSSGAKGLTGRTRLKASVRAGAYAITVTCDGRDHPGSGRIKIVEELSAPPTSHPQKTPSQESSPVAPVRAGGGGTAVLAAGTADRVQATGPGTPHAVIGLVLAGVAAVAVAFRSSRRSRTDAD
ncbi:hypothetical protein [Streptomyces sp. NBC_00829]|uniref:hypothetical protein n=1 Tax=Streptomyces sp. NBC_00829 TaxID=2903679 RepID=UPI0038681E57|nr:hypothetical protein OG293_22785 [Streptomyces sp. NBC_00829]